MMRPKSTPPPIAIFLGTFVLYGAVGVWALPRVDGVPHFDQYREYIMVGSRLLEHGSIMSPFVLDDARATRSSIMPPLYGVVVAGVFAIFGVETPAALYALVMLNALAIAAAAVLVYWIGRRLGGVRAAWLAAVLLACNPIVLRVVPLVWDTSLFILGVTVSVWWCLRLGDGPLGWRRVLPFGVWLGVLALLNPAFTLCYPLLVIWSVTRQWGWNLRRISTSAVLAVAGWVVVVLPWTIRNYVVFGEWEYVRGGAGQELWFGVCPEAGTSEMMTIRLPLLSEKMQAHLLKVGEHAYLKECGRLAVDAIRDNPMRYVRLCGLRAIDYWLGTVYTHRRPGQGGWPVHRLRALGTVMALFELALLLGALLIRRQFDVPLRWLAAIALVMSMTYVLTHVQLRYRAPCEPLLALLIAGAVAGRRADDPAPLS